MHGLKHDWRYIFLNVAVSLYSEASNNMAKLKGMRSNPFLKSKHSYVINHVEVLYSYHLKALFTKITPFSSRTETRLNLCREIKVQVQVNNYTSKTLAD